MLVKPYSTLNSRPTRAEISAGNLRHNFSALRQRSGHGNVLAMVKANAYGHGIVECSEVLAEAGATMLGVAFAEEALSLRRSPLLQTIPIVVVTPPFPHEAELYCNNNLRFSAASKTTFRRFSETAERLGVVLSCHVCIDTGMSRDGIQPAELIEFLEFCSMLPNIVVEGLFTHFATADQEDRTFTELQGQRFTSAIEQAVRQGYQFQWIHAANSAALIRMPETRCNLVRAGIALYGYSPFEFPFSQAQLLPVLALKTAIVSLRCLPAGTGISYGLRYTTSRTTTIATIPLGYGDGLSRQLSGSLSCLINGKYFPVVGTICMDECMVDVGDEPIQVGDEVVVIGSQQHNTITADTLAQTLGTISYEVLTSISSRVPRIIVE